jgi:hypothetical protein
VHGNGEPSVCADQEVVFESVIPDQYLTFYQYDYDYDYEQWGSVWEQNALMVKNATDSTENCTVVY